MSSFFTPSSALPHHRLEFSVDDYDVMPDQDEYDHSNPAAEPSYGLEEEIKMFEAMQAQQYRVQQTRTRRRRRPKPGVTFADQALLYSSDRTIEEVKRSWISREELNTFKAQRKEIVKVLKKSNFDLVAVEESGQYCLRGYEPYFSMEVNKAMKYARTLVTSLVMAEQDKQRTGGYFDDDAMREACSGASQWARDNALQLGRNDEVEVYGELVEHDDDESYTSEPDYSESSRYGDSFDGLDTDEYDDDDEYTIEERSLQSSVLGKRNCQQAECEQPEFTSRQRTPAPVETDPELAERIECALKLVAALKCRDA